jgi:serine/threonine-protein kinase
MGRVYKALDKELSRTVALKTLLPELVSDHLLTQRFKQELLLASKISHRNILRIHDLGEVDGVKFISMAFIEGRDLNQLLKEEGPLPLERSLKIARQLCEALDAAHSEGVVHRDFKPQNVLVGNDDHIYVSDFGLATSLESAKMGMTRTGAVMGTPRYMSPEQVEGKPADSRCDLYALGLVLYEMVTGATPFSAESTWQLMYQRVQVKPKDVKLVNPALPDYISRVIMHCLEKEPANRYQSAKEILADLDAGRSPALTGARTLQIKLLFAQKRLWYVTGVGILVLLGLFFAISKARHWAFPAPILGTRAPVTTGPPSISQIKFVAVLPFRVLGEQPSLGYIAEGLAEALSAKLFQVKDIRMASPGAVEKAKQKDSVEKIAKELGVNFVVHGTVQGSGNKIRIVVNLEDVGHGNRLLDQEFSGMQADLLTLEDQIYGSMIGALELKPTSDEMARAGAHPTEKVDAYDLYLRGQNAMRGQQDVKNVQAGIGLFEQALRIDPNFALAYTGIADASLIMYREKKESFWSQRALAAAQQAQRLNANLPEVHFALGSIYNATGKNAEAVAELQRALQLAPNSDEAYRRLGEVYLAAGQSSDAIQAYQKAVEINPYYWVNYNSIGIAYSQLGDYDKALAALRRVTELEPDNSFGYLNLGAVYFQQGKYEECLPYYQKSLQIQPSSKTFSNLGTAYFYLRRYPDAVSMFEKAVEMNPNDEAFVGNLADAYRWSGQREKANVTYDKAIALAYKTLAVNPRNSDTLGSLALYYAKKDMPAQALSFARRARSINQDDVSLVYTEAVVEALAGHHDEAMRVLREALRRGYSVQEAKSDPELGRLQSRPEFVKLLAEFGKTK